MEKIAISLPRSLLARIEEARRDLGESRSAFFRHAAELLIRQRQQADRVSEYVAGYRREPEGPTEIAAAEASAAELFAAEEWE